MTPRPFAHIALQLLLAVFLVIPGIAAPAQAIADEFEAAAAASMAVAMAGQQMPCDEKGTPTSADDAAPCDCCTAHACDLSACLGTACLPDLPRLAANVPPATKPGPWRQQPLPLGVIDTPLRPPIG